MKKLMFERIHDIEGNELFSGDVLYYKPDSTIRAVVLNSYQGAVIRTMNNTGTIHLSQEQMNKTLWVKLTLPQTKEEK